MNRILAAAAAGAIAFAAIPAAAAQDLPERTTDARGETYFLNEERTHYVRELQEAAKPFAQLDAGQKERAVEVGNAAIAGLIDAGVIRDQPTNQPEAAPAPAPAPSAAPAEKPIGPSDVNPADLAPVAGGNVKFPPVLTIGDTIYFLTADGHTYITDMARVAEMPTPEEVAASQKLVRENESEVGRQALEAARAAGEAPAVAEVEYSAGEAPADAAGAADAITDAAEVAAATAADATRGIAAETGSNTLMRVLAGLLIASVLGAAAFAYGRRQLV